MKTLIFVDRDGTLTFDKKYHLGRQKNWKSLIKFLPYTIQGLKVLNKIPNSRVYVVTNQPGVAVKDFPLLTLKRAHQVNKYVMSLIKKKGIKLYGYEVCEKAHPKYTKKRSEFNFDKKLVGDFPCIKPKPGMINSILKKEKLKKSDVKIYLIGDRISDVKSAINAKGFGILVPFKGEPYDKKAMKKIKNSYVAKNFLDAAKFITKNYKA